MSVPPCRSGRGRRAAAAVGADVATGRLPDGNGRCNRRVTARSGILERSGCVRGCPAHATPRGGPMRGVVVEDDAELAETVAVGLRREGMATDVAGDGHDALARLELVAYDVVVLDRDLPGLHGDQVCRAIIADGRPRGALMLTAARGVGDRVQGLGLGPAASLPKPFAFAELVARIRALARRA